jgi:hypothetical protein
MLQEVTSQNINNFYNYYDFELIYRSDGGDYCDMKKARKILSKVSDRVAIVFKKKGDDKLIGFTTDKKFQYE